MRQLLHVGVCTKMSFFVTELLRCLDSKDRKRTTENMENLLFHCQKISWAFWGFYSSVSHSESLLE